MKILICLTIALIINSCNNICPVNKVTLSDFWNETDEPIGLDPLGGYILIYWVDNHKNSSHTLQNGVAAFGPFVIKAFSQEAYDAAQTNSYMTEERMKQLQSFIYATDKYRQSGFHFIQYDNIIWRNRADGKVFIDRASHYFSKPVIVDMQSTICLNPVYAANFPSCANYQGLLIPNPIATTHQNLKALPVSNTLSENELMKNCNLKLSHGLEISE